MKKAEEILKAKIKAAEEAEAKAIRFLEAGFQATGQCLWKKANELWAEANAYSQKIKLCASCAMEELK